MNVEGYKLTISKETAKRLVALTHHPVAGEPSITLPMRIRILGEDPAVIIKREKRWG